MEEEERAAARPTAGEEKAARTKAREIVVVDVPMSPAIVMATSGVALCLVVLLFSRPLTMSIILTPPISLLFPFYLSRLRNPVRSPRSPLLIEYFVDVYCPYYCVIMMWDVGTCILLCTFFILTEQPKHR